MSKILKNIQKYLIYLCFLIVPIIFTDIFIDGYNTPKLIILVLLISLVLLLKAIELLFNKNYLYKYSHLDPILILLPIAYIVTTIVNPSNGYHDSLFSPGITLFMVASFIIYIFLIQLDKTDYNPISEISVLSGSIVSIITVLAFLRIIKSEGFSPMGDLYTTLIFLLSILPISIHRVVKSNKISIKLFHSVSGFLIFTALIATTYMILPGKKTLPSSPGLNISWSIAIDTLKTNPIFGFGPGNYVDSYSLHKPLFANSENYWQTRFNNSSSNFLTLITETGILGLMAYFVIIFYYIKKMKIDKPEFVSALIIIISSFFLSFSPAIYIFLFYFMMQSHKLEKSKNKINLIYNIAVSLVVLVSLSFIGLFFYKQIFAEYWFKKSVDAVNTFDGTTAYETINKSVSINKNVDKYHLLSSVINLGIAQGISKKEDISENDRETITKLIQQSINEAKASVSINSKRVSNWQNLGNIYRDIIPFAKGADQFALGAYNEAVYLEPVNPNLRIEVGNIYYLLGDIEKAIKNYELAVIAKPDYANSHYNLAIAYKTNNQLEKASEEINIVLNLVGKESADYETAKKELESIDSLKTPEDQKSSEFEPKIDI